jgi:hypothetical protein
MVYAAALDISKAFDSVSHQKLMATMEQAGIPSWIIQLISNWYSKIQVAVRWNGCFSRYFKINSGVRQGSIMSPYLFNLYINPLISRLRLCNSGCLVNNCFIGCIFYADDMLLISASVNGLQDLMNVCVDSLSNLDLKFNCSKSFCIAFGHMHDQPISNMCLGNSPVHWSESIKYLGLVLKSGNTITVDESVIKRTFYSSCNAILSNSSGQSELTKLFLLESYCLPILTYCTTAIDLSQNSLNSFNVCWNMMVRRVFHFNKWESVSMFIAGLGRLNFTHLFYCMAEI